MSDRTVRSGLEQQLDRLREEFDSAFAEPIRSFDGRREQLMCFSAGGTRFAIAMLGLQSLVRCTELTPIPARAPAFLGLTVVRAQIIPVFSLTRLVGIGTHTAECHWLILLHGPTPVGLALDSLEGYAHESGVQPANSGHASPLVSGLIKHNGNIYAIVRAAEVYKTIAGTATENGRNV